MIAQSRPIRKSVKPLILRKKSSSKKKNNVDEKTKGFRCKYKLIPPETRIKHPQWIHCLYGDIPVMAINDKVVTDLSFLNEFKAYRDLQAIDMYNQRVLSMKLEDKNLKDLSLWPKFVENLRQTDKHELWGWANVIQTFCQKYQRILGRQTRKKPKSDLRRNYFTEVTKNTEETKRKLFAAYSCIQSRYRLKNHQNLLNELIFSDRMLKDMGYSIEDFAHEILESGIPQLFSFEDYPNDSGIQTVLERYFTLGPDNFETPEFESLLCLKHGYVRRIRYKVCYLMNYETNSFGIDTILAIVSKEDPYFRYPPLAKKEIKEEFMQSMAIKEKESEQFLACYYNMKLSRQFENLDKVCGVKEIDYDDELLLMIKKYEET